MKRRDVFVGTLAALLSLPVVFAAACSDHDHSTGSAACIDPQQLSLPDCESGADRFSDEACTSFDDALSRSTTTDDSRAAVITAPTEGQALTAATPFTFTWVAPTASLVSPSMNDQGWAETAWRLVDPLPKAEAHCEAFTGRAYELRLLVGDAVVFRRQTSALSWSPDAAQWQRIVSAAGTRTVELRIYTAQFNTNQINQGSGPFVAMASRHFTIH